MEKKIQRTVTTTTISLDQIVLTEEEISTILLEHFGLDGGRVDWDEERYGGIKGCTVSKRTESVIQTEGD